MLDITANFETIRSDGSIVVKLPNGNKICVYEYNNELHISTAKEIAVKQDSNTHIKISLKG